jgi:hypothetical protein
LQVLVFGHAFKALSSPDGDRAQIEKAHLGLVGLYFECVIRNLLAGLFRHTPSPQVARHHNESCEWPTAPALNGGASPGSVAGLIYIARAAPGLSWLHSRERIPSPREAGPAKLATKKRYSGGVLRRTGEDKLADAAANVKQKALCFAPKTRSFSLRRVAVR